MSLPRTPYVHHNAYQDYGHRVGWRSQWLCSSTTATNCSVAIGIIVTIAAARLLRLLIRVCERWTRKQIEARTLENIAWTNILEAWQDARPRPIQLTASSASSTASPPTMFSVNWIKVLCKIAAAVVVFIVYAATLAAGVVTSFLITSGTALSQHPECGLYGASTSPGLDVINITRAYETAAQIESASWATNYFDENVSKIPGSLITPGSITIQKRNTTCPFPDHICYGGDVKPVEITTGPVSASAIGVHAPRTLEIQRTSICSPLNMNSTYIRLMSQEGKDYTYGYYYGQTSLGDVTYRSVRHGDIGDIPIYQVWTLKSDGLVNPDTEWIPIPELMPQPGSTVSLIIIISQKIFYSEPRIDPIFPAQNWTTVGGDAYWINLSGPGTVLACIDRTEWRDPTTSTGWVPFTELPPDSDMRNTHVAGGIALLRNALEGSDMFNMLFYRLGAALNAQSRISGFVSLPLAPEQWKVEIEELFKISVARILINVRDIARGAKAKYWGYEKLPEPDGLCYDTYKMSTDGWSSLAVGWSSGILVFAFLIMFLAIPVVDEELLWEVLLAELTAFADSTWRRQLEPLGEILIQCLSLSIDCIGKLFK